VRPGEVVGLQGRAHAAQGRAHDADHGNLVEDGTDRRTGVGQADGGVVLADHLLQQPHELRAVGIDRFQRRLDIGLVVRLDLAVQLARAEVDVRLDPVPLGVIGLHGGSGGGDVATLHGGKGLFESTPRTGHQAGFLAPALEAGRGGQRHGDRRRTSRRLGKGLTGGRERQQQQGA
jgi:hypothetical protein